ncbi:hypothetical protein [Glycomyces harbinensis]|uniref:Uncharacterized protein n=1 Tax=Glycomyces harbinensis TaxID=58114 RepID=A0A1G7BYG2_9ACTN|nr:hypothetical protein [Glycomyces harbinensis]SDE32124.1 hypothetical protein SAMN05216270_11849 [Glycomyces harbinensis]
MNTPLRLGAALGALSGLLIVVASSVEFVAGETAATGLALALSPAFGLPLIVALYFGQQHASGALASIGFTLNLVGLGLFGGAAFALNVVLIHVDAAVVDALPGAVTAAFLGSALVFSAGTVVFGVAMLRAGVYPRVPAAVYAFAFPLIALLAPLPDNLFISAVHVVSGAGLIWLAVALSEKASRPQVVTRAPAAV